MAVWPLMKVSETSFCAPDADGPETRGWVPVGGRAFLSSSFPTEPGPPTERSTPIVTQYVCSGPLSLYGKPERAIPHTHARHFRSPWVRREGCRSIDYSNGFRKSV